ncbi:hypothetical protein CH380_13300 [Leptospira adleri]|uniref:Uncharacterized protein n=1 Tax=Leptospira adleri TaxID=2023186 RepID=A0A2M9YME7_9LEPT|nr:hypothetical protein CH380_13300 [Leptospira adleri]PJZ61746.1 hypothetical protein CH376_11580 [Leptospira adleri]
MIFTKRLCFCLSQSFCPVRKRRSSYFFAPLIAGLNRNRRDFLKGPTELAVFPFNETGSKVV